MPGAVYLGIVLCYSWTTVHSDSRSRIPQLCATAKRKRSTTINRGGERQRPSRHFGRGETREVRKRSGRAEKCVQNQGVLKKNFYSTSSAIILYNIRSSSFAVQQLVAVAQVQ